MTEFAIGMAVLCLLSPQGSMFSGKKKTNPAKREVNISESQYKKSAILFLNQMKNPEVKSVAVQAAVEKPAPDNNVSLKAQVKDIIYRKAYKSNKDGTFYEENQEYLVLESPAIARLVIESNHCRNISVKKIQKNQASNKKVKEIKKEIESDNDDYDYIAVPHGEDPEEFLKKDPKVVKETSEKLMKDNKVTLEKINRMQELEKINDNIIVIRNKNGEEFRIHARVLKALLMDDLKKNSLIMDLTKEEKVPSLKELEEKKKKRIQKKKNSKIIKKEKISSIKEKKEKVVKKNTEEIDVYSLFEDEISNEKEKESQLSQDETKVMKKKKNSKITIDKPYGDLSSDEKEATLIKALRLIF